MRETWARSLGWEDPLEKEQLPTPVFWPGESHGLYSPWGRKESDTTKPPSLLLSFSPFLLSALCIWASCLRASKAWTEPLDGPSVFSFPSYHDGQPWGQVDGGYDRQWSRTRKRTLVASWVSTSLCSLVAATEPPSEFGPGWGRSFLLAAHRVFPDMPPKQPLTLCGTTVDLE